MFLAPLLNMSKQVKPEMWNSQICKWSLCCSRRQCYTLYTEPLVLIITSMNLEQSNWSTKWLTARVPCRDLQSFVYWSEAEGRTHSSQGTRTIHTVKNPQISPEIVSGLCRHRRGWLLRNLPTSSRMCPLSSSLKVRWWRGIQGFLLWLMSVKLTFTPQAGVLVAFWKMRGRKKIRLEMFCCFWVFQCGQADFEGCDEHTFSTCGSFLMVLILSRW